MRQGFKVPPTGTRVSSLVGKFGSIDRLTCAQYAARTEAVRTPLGDFGHKKGGYYAEVFPCSFAEYASEHGLGNQHGWAGAQGID